SSLRFLQRASERRFLIDEHWVAEPDAGANRAEPLGLALGFLVLLTSVPRMISSTVSVNRPTQVSGLASHSMARHHGQRTLECKANWIYFIPERNSTRSRRSCRERTWPMPSGMGESPLSRD